MIVYVEYVLINNFIIDYLLLKATFKTTGLPVKNGRLLFCALFSALFALFYPLISLRRVFLTLIKISVGFLIMLLANDYPKVKSYFVNTLLFFLYTFLFGGALTGIYNLFDISKENEVFIALAFVPVWVIYKCTKSAVVYVYRKKHVRAYTYPVKITIGNTSKKCMAFLDTGNGVYHKDTPVIFCSIRFAKEFLVEKDLPSIGRLRINTLSGRSEKLTLKTSSVWIYTSDKPNIHNNIIMCVTEQGMEDGYDVILHPALMEERYAEKSVFAS